MLRKSLFLWIALSALATAQAAPALAQSLNVIHYQMPDQNDVWQRQQLQPPPANKMGDWRAELRRRIEIKLPISGATLTFNGKAIGKLKF